MSSNKVGDAMPNKAGVQLKPTTSVGNGLKVGDGNGVKDPFELLKDVFKKDIEDAKRIAVKGTDGFGDNLLKFGMCDNFAACCNPMYCCASLSAMWADSFVAMARTGLTDEGEHWPIGLCECTKDPQLLLSCLLCPLVPYVHAMADTYGVPSASMFLAFYCWLAWAETCAANVPCVGCCMIAAPRGRMRRKYGIAGSVVDDAITTMCCPCCVFNQMAYVSIHNGDAPSLFKALDVPPQPWGRVPVGTRRPETMQGRPGDSGAPGQQAGMKR